VGKNPTASALMSDEDHSEEVENILQEIKALSIVGK